MPRVCTVCAHPDRRKIDAALASETSSNRRIATQYGLSEASVRRHRSEHLPIRLVKAAEQEDVRNAIDVYGQLKDINVAVRNVLTQAQRDGDGELALKASDRILKQLELQGRLIGELQDGDTINVIVSPQWVALRTVIIAALENHPDARLSVATAIKTVEGVPA